MRLSLFEDVSASEDAVFNVMTDLSGMSKNISGIVKAEEVNPANDGSSFGVGTRWRETRVMFGKEATEELYIVEFDASRRRYVVESISCGALYRSELSVEPIDGGSRVVMTMTSEAQSIFSKIMSAVMQWLLGSKMQELLQQDLRDIKAVAENGVKEASEE